LRLRLTKSNARHAYSSLECLTMDPLENERRSSYFASLGGRFDRCLAPGVTCTEAAIRAHSVQNSIVLDLLAYNDHVKAFRAIPDWNTGPRISLENVSRNHATTFTGLCSTHDAAIFRPIDREKFEPSNVEHLFLYAYRSGLRELHATMEAAAKVQSAYQKRVELGLDNSNEMSPAGMMEIQHMIKAYQTYLYMTAFDRCYIAKQWNHLAHDIRMLTHNEPTIAVSSLFSIDGSDRDGELIRVCINIFPVSRQQSVVIFSYLPEDASLARVYLQSILDSDANAFYQKYLLSKLVLNSCENLVLSPAYINKWSGEKKEAVERYFVQTLHSGNLEVDNKHLYLF
jgi:hypothetical protein